MVSSSRSLGESYHCFSCCPLWAFRWRQGKHGCLFLNRWHETKLLVIRSARSFDWHQNSCLHGLKVKLDRSCAFASRCNLTLNILLSLIIELHSFAGDRWGSFFKSWCKIDIFRYKAFIDQAHHSFIDSIFGNGRGVVQILHI